MCSDFNRATSYRYVVILKNKIKIKTKWKNINEIMSVCHKGIVVCRIILQPIKQDIENSEHGVEYKWASHFGNNTSTVMDSLQDVTAVAGSHINALYPSITLSGI